MSKTEELRQEQVKFDKERGTYFFRKKIRKQKKLKKWFGKAMRLHKKIDNEYKERVERDGTS